MKRIVFKKYAGVRIRGKFAIELPSFETSNHLDRAEWLTAQVESGGKFGAVMSYDGTGITAGIHQAIAVYPRVLSKGEGKKARSQGPLWKLLVKIKKALFVNPYNTRGVFTDIERAEWLLTTAGDLRWAQGSRYAGALVTGFAIRNQLTGDRSGVMPTAGPGRERAEAWARAFASTFSNASTYKAQRDHGREFFKNRAKFTKLRFCNLASRDTSISNAVYGPTLSDIELLNGINPALDLAMSVFWSNTVNAPGAALRRLCRAVDVYNPIDNPGDFARLLIRKLGNTSFGRWDDDIKNGRYQRTRKHALKLWPRELFRGPGAIMPKDLPG